jgi:protein-disulfide isomerase
MSRATVAVCAVLLAGGLAAATAIRVWIPARCAPPGEADKERLIGFVRLKYDLPSTAGIGVADGGAVFSSCFRKLVFATLSGRPFRAELFASPDFRFLTGELLDARPDPKQAAERRRQTAEALADGNVPARGSETAPVTLAVFSDFQCPYCALMAKTVNDLARSEGGRLRILYHYFPLSMHPWARPAAEAAACAQRQGNAAFWDLHDFLFAHQRELSPDNFGQRLTDWARTTAGVDQKDFERCVSQTLTSGQVERDIALGNELAVNSTPTVYLDGKLVGDPSLEKLRSLIARAPSSRP